MTEVAPPRAAARDSLLGGWLALIALLVIGMIIVGGATRLTDSGLSITEWRPISGALPPLTQRDWDHLFRLYQDTTEYQVQNRGMSLADFQFIYWWEWGHRLLGRVIGVVFALPFLFFWATGRLQGRFWPILGLFVLGGLQGAIGWWMVSSGLAGRLDVAPERLATHLGLAFLILGFAAWLALDAFAWPRGPSRLGAPRWIAPAFAAALSAQILLGALVAGSDAGRAYSDWPTIGGDWIPATYGATKPFLADFAHNHATLQFNHRTLGYGVALLAVAIGWLGLARAKGPARDAALAIGVVALAQAALGIGTIVMGAPLGVSLLHQGGAVLLWLCAIAFWRSVEWR